MSQTWLYCLSNPLHESIYIVNTCNNIKKLLTINTTTPYTVILAKKLTNPEGKREKIYTLLSQLKNGESDLENGFNVPLELIKCIFSVIDGQDYNPEVPVSSRATTSSVNKLGMFLRDREKVKHDNRKGDVWTGRYDSSTGAIIREGVKYASFSAFASAHYEQTRSDRGKFCNGWLEILVKRDGNWILADSLRR